MAALVFSIAEVRAAEPWLTLSGSPDCPSVAAELASRIESQIAGTRNPELSVEVVVRDKGRNTESVVRIFRRSEPVASKTLVLPTCDEALDAVATVAALAVSVQRDADPEPAGPELASRPAEMPSAPTASPGAAPAVDRGVEQESSSPTTNPWRLHWAGGVDVGTLAEPTAVLGAGIGAPLGDAELRVLTWYGLPSSREEASSGDETSSMLETRRAEFGAVSADYCRGLDAERWFGICAGLEGRVTRLERVDVSGDRPRQERTHLLPGLGATADAAFVHRALAFQPKLAFSLQMPLLGTPALEEGPIFRVLFGGEFPL